MDDRIKTYSGHNVPYPLGLPIEMTATELAEMTATEQASKKNSEFRETGTCKTISTQRKTNGKEALHKELKSYKKYTERPTSNFKCLSKLASSDSCKSPTLSEKRSTFPCFTTLNERSGSLSRVGSCQSLYTMSQNHIQDQSQEQGRIQVGVKERELDYVSILEKIIKDKVTNSEEENVYKYNGTITRTDRSSIVLEPDTNQDKVTKTDFEMNMMSRKGRLSDSSRMEDKMNGMDEWSDEDEMTATSVPPSDIKDKQRYNDHEPNYYEHDIDDEGTPTPSPLGPSPVPPCPHLPPLDHPQGRSGAPPGCSGAPPGCSGAPPPPRCSSPPLAELPPQIKKKRKWKSIVRKTFSDPYKTPKILPQKERIAEQSKKVLLDHMFELIRRGMYNEMVSFLNCHGAEVEIVPKVGCDPVFYNCVTNIANMCDRFGNTPLLIACKMEPTREDIIMLLLTFGADPNHNDLNGNTHGDSPLQFAAKSFRHNNNSFRRNSKERNLMEGLVLHGANLSYAVHNLCKKLMQPNNESYDSMMELCVLVNPHLMMLTEEPIETAHLCSVILHDTGNVKDEYSTDCEKLANDADMFALSYLDSCHKLWEARRLLRPQSIIDNALTKRKKSFIAHPFCQELLLEEWYGGLQYRDIKKRLGLLFTYFFGCLLIPGYTINMLIKSRGKKNIYQYTKLEDLMTKLMTPYLCFVADALNYLILLVLLISVCQTMDQDNDLQNPNSLEIIMWLCLLSRFMIELNQLSCNKRYFTNFWNYVDTVVVGLLFIAILYRLIACYCLQFLSIGWRKRNALNVIYIYSCTEIVLCLRLLDMLDITYTLGPLQLAVKKMMGDVVKLVVLLVTVILAFSISISSILSYAEDRTQQKIVPGFSQIISSSVNLFWSLFDLAETQAMSVPGDQSTTCLTKLLFGIYLVIAVVIMLNMLIAMLNNTYHSIWSNQDVEWKFSRAKLFKEYKKGIPFVFPFLLIAYPIIVIYKYYTRKHKKVQSSVESNVLIDSLRRESCVETDGATRRTFSLDLDGKNQEKIMRYKLLGILSERYANKTFKKAINS